MSVAVFRHASWRAFVIVAVLLASTPRQTCAFESDEHEKLGNIAFHLALEYFRENHPDREKVYEAARALDGRPGKYASDTKPYGIASYGDLIACVDYFLSPEKILTDSWKRGRGSRGPGGLPAAGDKVLELDDCHGWFGNAFFQATHNNHAHFQYNVLMSYRMYHVAAISLARDEKAFFAALVTNAIADHYLHDFFAPGHIYTRRDGLTDVPATALHDIRNKRGADFVPEHFASESMKCLIDFICQGSVKDCWIRDGLDLAMLAEKSDGGDVATALTELIDGQTVRLKGDYALWEAGPDGLRQRVLMLLIQARSVLDVLEGNNSFQLLNWEGESDPTTVQMSFGHYVQPKDQYSLLLSNTVVGLSFHRETMVAGNRAGRNAFTAETPLGVIPLDQTGWKSLENLILLPTLGYGIHFEGGTQGHGPTFRLIAAVPQTEFAFSAYVRYFFYPTSAGDTRRRSFGLRFDSGFSGYLTAFIALGVDSATTPDGALRSGIIGMAGLQVSFPVSRVAGSWWR